MGLLDPQDLDGMIDDAGTDVLVGNARVRGIFRNGYVEGSVGLGVEDSSTHLVMTQVAVDAANVRKGVVVSIGSTDYQVKRVEPFSAGLLRVQLQKP